MAAKAFMVLLTPQNVWIMPPKLQLWTMSRFSSFQGINILLDAVSNIQTQTHLKYLKPSIYIVYSSHIFFIFCPVLPKY